MEHKISLLKRAGESVFPVKIDMGDGSKIEGMGMSMRDYFAAKAMQGIITTAAAPVLTSLAGLDDDIAKTAYRMADAMLRAREK